MGVVPGANPVVRKNVEPENIEPENIEAVNAEPGRRVLYSSAVIARELGLTLDEFKSQIPEFPELSVDNHGLRETALRGLSVERLAIDINQNNGNLVRLIRRIFNDDPVHYARKSAIETLITILDLVRADKVKLSGNDIPASIEILVGDIVLGVKDGFAPIREVSLDHLNSNRALLLRHYFSQRATDKFELGQAVIRAVALELRDHGESRFSDAQRSEMVDMISWALKHPGLDSSIKDKLGLDLQRLLNPGNERKERAPEVRVKVVEALAQRPAEASLIDCLAASLNGRDRLAHPDISTDLAIVSVVKGFLERKEVVVGLDTDDGKRAWTHMLSNLGTATINATGKAHFKSMADVYIELGELIDPNTFGSPLSLAPTS